MKAQPNGAEERYVATVKDLDEVKAKAAATKLLAKTSGEAAAELRGRLAASENKVN